MRQLLTFCTICLPIISFAAEKIPVRTDVESVVVFLDGAEITRSAEVSVSEGLNTFVFTNLSVKLVNNSIRFKADGLDIISISTERNFLNNEVRIPEIKRLSDSVDIYSDESQDLLNQINALNHEWEFIKSNMAYVQEDNSAGLTELKSGGQYVRERSLEISRSLAKLQYERGKLTERILVLQMQLDELNARNRPARKNVTVKLQSNSKGKHELQLSYLVTHANWEPAYDIYSKDVDEKIELSYKAEVYNNTDIDWNNVKLSLSTADPRRGADRPYLSVWELNYKYQQRHLRSSAMDNYKQESKIPAQAAMGNTLSEEIGIEPTDSVLIREISLSELSTVFDIERPYSIPSDAKPYIVNVVEYELEATYSHVTVPKMEHAVYLLAKITGWERLNLVEGKANIYFKDNYIGESNLNTSLVGDSLDISFGRDNKIQVQRTKLVDLGKQQSLGNNRKVSFSYEIILKNNRNTEVDIEVLDQLPVAKEEDIVVSAGELSGAIHNEVNGTLTWNVHLEPSESKKIRLSFSIKFPKNKDVDIEKVRKYRTVKFL